MCCEIACVVDLLALYNFIASESLFAVEGRRAVMLFSNHMIYSESHQLCVHDKISITWMFVWCSISLDVDVRLMTLHAVIMFARFKKSFQKHWNVWVERIIILQFKQQRQRFCNKKTWARSNLKFSPPPSFFKHLVVTTRYIWINTKSIYTSG